MKLYFVHFISESCDHYYEVFRGEKQPSQKQIGEYFWTKLEHYENYNFKSVEEAYENLGSCGEVVCTADTQIDNIPTIEG